MVTSTRVFTSGPAMRYPVRERATILRNGKRSPR